MDSTDGNATASIMTGDVYSNFDPVKSIPTMTIRLHWLFLMMPLLTIIPAALYMGWRRLAVIFLLLFVLSNLLLYLFVPWVASWWEPARAMEDTRYFLPAMPPAAMLSGLAMTDALLVPKKRRVLGICVLAFLVVAGFAVAEAGIGYHMDRLRATMPNDGPGGPPPPPPAQYLLVTVSQLIADAEGYNDTLVEVRNCTFERWMNPTSLLFRDASSSTLLRIDLLGYTPPSLGPGTMFHVKGSFRWFDGNLDGVVQPPEVSISVKGGTADSLVLA